MAIFPVKTALIYLKLQVMNKADLRYQEIAFACVRLKPRHFGGIFDCRGIWGYPQLRA